MKRCCFLMAISFALIISIGCDATKPTGESDFALYFLTDDTLRAYEAMQQEITELKLASGPWLSEEDIEYYDFSSHCIYLKTDKRDFFEGYDEGRFEPVLIDKPFVVVAGGSRCYIGSIHSGLLATAPPGPYMGEGDVWFYPLDVMHISRGWGSEEDLRSMDQIREAFSVLGLYRGGLDVRLDAVDIVEQSDTSTVQYTFTITNNDADNLLVLDPDLMGSSRFHYFTNGVVFRGEDTHYWSQYKEVIKPLSFENTKPSYKIELKTGEIIECTEDHEYFYEGAWVSIKHIVSLWNDKKKD